MKNEIRVLVVDDSATAQETLIATFNMTTDIQVVGAAASPLVALDMIMELNPDVVTLDVEMTGMVGISFLSNLKRVNPVPVIVISAMTTKSFAHMLKSLALGVVDYVKKPDDKLKGDFAAFAQDLHKLVRRVAKPPVIPLEFPSENAAQIKKVSTISAASSTAGNSDTSENACLQQIVAIGASAGGAEAIRTLLREVPVNAPAIVITLHIAPNFNTAFAKNLDSLCVIKVVEATQNQLINSGTAYIAPGGKHLSVQLMNGGYVCHLDTEPPVNRHRPAVDVLFDSVNKYAKGNAIGVLLTGMGSDGAAGLLRLRDSGCYTIAQDESSSVVWGMPGSAVQLGAVDEILALDEIAPRIMNLLPNWTKHSLGFKF